MTYEAYRIAVKISLINNVSTGLLAMSRQMVTLQGHGKDLQKELNGIKMLGLAGTAMSAAGFMGLGIIGKMIKPAQEYAHQLNIINMAGWTQKEIAESVGDAWKNTGKVITTTATENLRTLLDLKNILGDLGEARMALPIVSRIQGVLAASSESKVSGNSKDLAYSMAKALDIIGAARNPGTFNTEAEAMAKVIIATQGRVTPEAYKSVFQYARQAKFGLNNEFKYQILPSLIQENSTTGGSGGGSRGVGPMLSAFYRWAIQGYVNKKALPELQSLGLVAAGTALSTTSTGTTIGAMKNAQLAASNPFAWVQSVLVPAIRAKYGNIGDKETLFHINQIMRGNQLGANLVGEFAFKPLNFLRDQQNVIRTMSTADAYQASLSNDPNTAFQALLAQWTNFKTAFMMGVVPVLIPALKELTSMFNTMAAWARSNPGMAQNLAIGFIALSGSLAFGGIVTLATAAFRGLGLVMAFTPLGGAAGIGRLALAIGGAGAGSLVGGLLLLGGVVAGLAYVITKATGDGTDPKGHPGMRFTGRAGGNQWVKDSSLSQEHAGQHWKQYGRVGGVWENDFVAPKRGGQAINNTIVMPNGEVLAKVVTRVQSRSSMHNMQGTTRHDGNMSLQPVGAVGAF